MHSFIGYPVMEGIYLIPIGTIDIEILKAIAKALNREFHIRTRIGDRIATPAHAYNRMRRQYHSTIILKELESSKPNNSTRILGIVDEDLFVPSLNFVFGEANISRGIALISLVRLRQEFYGLRPDKRLFQIRAIKEAIHEIGHTYGLAHCPNRGCIMHFSNSLRDTDIKGPGFCKSCSAKLHKMR
jgi:archaemetzincin